ncbi:MAG: EAL domain-containing protein, partial [Ruminococcus sp.]|nr:EAL domain-containing protein [Ruminococcus sp.]
SRTDEEYRVLSNFLQAIKRNEIVFYLQPQCRTSSGKIVGAEALARWVKPDGTVIPPDSFIPVLEKRGLISDLDMYIWEEVCRWQSKWIADGHTPLPISVNVSVADIQHTDLPAVFEKLAEKYSLDRKLIKIEITESSYISNTTLIRNTVRSLREKGFTVLMDDFGSGYSTLNMLKTLNIDIIKLDAQFLNIDEGNEEKSIHILESVTNMAQSIGVPIIVEGVETKEQKDFLQDLGCRYIQGYYFYQPMPTAEYEKLIADPDNIDTSGISFKSNVQFRLRELLDKDIYSDTMLNNILGPCAIYSWHGEDLDIIRYNEQFYEAVNIPNFKERLTSIQQFMPKSDLPSMYKLLHDAVSDRLNGAVGVLHFYKTDGTLTTFYMRFYYLHSDGEQKIFYGSVRNITKLSTLEKQMSLLSYISDITVLFLSRTHEGEIRFSVLFNALEPEIGMSAHELEALLNSQDLMRIIDPDKRSPDFNMILQKIIRSESFATQLYIKDKNGDPLPLNVTGNYIPDDTNTLDYIVTLGKKTL